MTSLQFSDIQTKSQIIKAKEIHVELPSQPVRYYRHGWQSWSLAAWTDPSPMPVPKPAIFHPLQVDAEHVHKKYLNGSWLGAVEFADGNILLLGALATDANVSLVEESSLSGQSEADEIEWFIAFGQENIVFEEYAEAVGKSPWNGQKRMTRRASGVRGTACIMQSMNRSCTKFSTTLATCPLTYCK